MTDAERGLALLRILRFHVDQKRREHTNALIKIAANEASSRVWVENNPNDGVGGMSGNPYGRVEWLEKSLYQAAKELAAYEDLVEYVTEHFIQKTN